MIPRFLNLQGMLGIAASLLLLGLFLTKTVEARHWRQQSGRFEQLYLGEQSARVATMPIIAPPPKPRGQRTSPMSAASPRSSALSRKGRPMTLKPGWPMLALMLPACSSPTERPQPLAAVAEQRLCPPPAQPPARLVVPPKKTDFLSTTRSPPPSKRSSSTN